MTRRFTKAARRLAGPLLLTLLVAATAGCGGGDGDGGGGGSAASSAATGEGPFPLTITDASGTAVVMASPPGRIISYSPGATEILFAIGAGGRVVAADRFSDYPAAAEALPKLEYLDPDPEAALALEPDLMLFASAQRAQLQQFRDLGMTVLFLPEPDSIEGIYEQIRLLGRLTANVDAAERLAAEMRDRIAVVTDAIAGVEQGPRVFFELSAELYTVAPDTFVGGMLSTLKAHNVAAGAPTSFPQLSAEAVIDADPEVVLLADAEFGESLASLAARPGWAGVSAVVNGRVYAIDPDTTNRPGPRIADGIEAIARALYPDRFP